MQQIWKGLETQEEMHFEVFLLILKYNNQGQAGWGFEQPGLEQPPYNKGAGTRRS